MYENGTGYGSTIINNHRKPIIRLQNGKNASLKPIIDNGQIDKINIGFGGNEYFSVPDLEVVDPTGKGVGAKLRPVLENQKISVNKKEVKNLIQKVNKPTLVLAHNKTLAAQLYAEFKNFFPEI